MVERSGRLSKATHQPNAWVGSVCDCERTTRTLAGYAHSEERDHECKPSPHRHPSAPTSGEETEQAARADCGSTAERTGCAGSKGAANVFAVPHVDERETATGGLAASAQYAEAVRHFASTYCGLPSKASDIERVRFDSI